MHEFNKLLSVALLAIFSASEATTAPLDARDDVGYVTQGSFNNGWVNLSPATGGIYVHGVKDQIKQPQIKVLMVGKPSRQDFVYLSLQEQADIWKYRQELLESMRKVALPSAAVAAKTLHKKSIAGLDWPRVIVEGSQVCVPSFDYSDADNWKDHLVCTYLEHTYGR